MFKEISPYELHVKKPSFFANCKVFDPAGLSDLRPSPFGDFASFAWQELPEISCNPVFLRLSFFHDLHLQTPSSDFYDLKDCPSFQFCRTMVTRSCAATQARAE